MNKGFISITIIILFTVLIFLGFYLTEIMRTQVAYNHTSNEALQHKYILESHYNYIKNEDKYLDEINYFLKKYIIKGRMILDKTDFVVDKRIVDNQESSVRLGYSPEEDVLQINIQNRYKEMQKSIVCKYSVINKFFLNNDGMIIYERLNNNKKDEFENIIDEIKDLKELNIAGLVILDKDLIIEEDLEIDGILVSVDEQLIVREGAELLVNGLFISINEPMGNINVIKDENIIKEVGINIPSFIRLELITKKYLEGLW